MIESWCTTKTLSPWGDGAEAPGDLHQVIGTCDVGPFVAFGSFACLAYNIPASASLHGDDTRDYCHQRNTRHAEHEVDNQAAAHIRTRGFLWGQAYALHGELRDAMASWPVQSVQTLVNSMKSKVLQSHHFVSFGHRKSFSGYYFERFQKLLMWKIAAKIAMFSSVMERCDFVPIPLALQPQPTRTSICCSHIWTSAGLSWTERNPQNY